MSAPLLLDNEILRDCLRLREANGLVPARGLLVSGVVKSTVLADVASSASSTTTTAAPAIASELVRQLHWELSSSTTLRPLAGLMGKAALLPDPWCAQGGCGCTVRRICLSCDSTLKQVFIQFFAWMCCWQVAYGLRPQVIL